MNGQRTKKVKDTIFIALPTDARRLIAGGCKCVYCVTHPDKPPTWDTLAIDATKDGFAHAVHYPEFAN